MSSGKGFAWKLAAPQPPATVFRSRRPDTTAEPVVSRRPWGTHQNRPRGTPKGEPATRLVSTLVPTESRPRPPPESRIGGFEASRVPKRRSKPTQEAMEPDLGDGPWVVRAPLMQPRPPRLNRGLGTCRSDLDEATCWKMRTS